MDGEIAWEWPRFNKAWQLPEVAAFWEALHQCDRAHEVLGDGCMFGLTSPDGPVKKPWRFMTTRARALAGLARLCDGSHHHVPCLGQRARASAYYTKQLCHIAVKGMLEPSELIGGIVEVEPDPQVLEKLTPQELQHLMETVRKLHRLCGHPNNRALLKLLRARGASEELKAAALQLACPECQESRTATPATKVSLEREDTIWKTLQMDAFYFRHAKQVHHFLLLLDEASSFAVVREIKVHHEDESENISTPEVITALEESWCQIFGYPARIRCDAEGAFRGTALAMWCSERGIEMTHVPAEHHAATGAVEKAIGELRWKMETFLRNEPIEPRRAASAMVQAHNHVVRVGGFAPAQWAFGRSESVSVNPAVACSEGTPGHAMAESLRLRIEAEHLHNKLSADARISRAKNSRSKPARQFLPGDVVYYQRHKVPRRAPANEDVDMPRMRIARWYGPARVLACETRVDSSSTSRMPSSVIWLVSCGRLLKAHIDQIRHGSERELLIANSSGTMAMPWTFTMMSTSLHKGAFEDLTTSRAERFEAKRRQTFRPSHQDGKRLKIVREEEGPDDLVSSSSEELLPDSEVHMDPTLKEGMHPDDSDELDIDRLLNDPSYMPLHPIEPPDAPMEESRASAEKSFQHQRKRHEMEDRPHHAKFPKKYQDPDLIGWCSNMENDFILSVTIDAPANEDEWRQILKEPKKFTSKAVKKGCEVAWHKLNPVQRQAMLEAKMLEVDSWLANRVCEKAGASVPKSRLMKMRWVLVFKAVDDPNQPNRVKAKARIVILGFSDPDQEFLDKAAPTLSRRSKMLLLNLACHRHWRTIKADAKAAFLQGSESQRSRGVFALPVKELGDKMNCGPKDTVRLLRAAYGLVSAPREWYRDVDKIATTTCGMHRLVCEPCLWVCKDEHGKVQGAVASHVDDFIVTGNEDNALWHETLQKFHQALNWSPWEPDPYLHCGVEIHQQSNYSFHLDHSQYASQIKQIDLDKSTTEVTPQELSQARAVLGSIQWRVSQTAPHHAARLSLLQSMLPHSRHSKDVLHQINKLVREVYSQRDLSVKVQQLDAMSDDDLTMIVWTDAAVANRPDLASTGGYVVGLCHKRILDGERSPVNLVAWRSGKLHRTARSSLAAELQALGEGEQELMFCRALWAELLGHEMNLLHPELTTTKVSAAAVIDAKSAFDAFHQGDGASAAFSMKEKYSALELLAVRENMTKQKTNLLWVSSDAQLADGLTKASAADLMRMFMAKGQLWNVKYDPGFVAAKKKKRQLPESQPEFDPELIEDETWSSMMQRWNASKAKTFRPCDSVHFQHCFHDHLKHDSPPMHVRRHLGDPFA